MAENVTLKTKILLRNDTKANWTSANPVLGKGEIGIETDTRLFKFGDGITNWNALKYADTEHAVLKEADPTTSDVSYSLGTKWVNTTNKKTFLLLGINEGSADWQQIALTKDLADLGAGDMLKSQFATNGKVGQGYVDKAIMADSATEATHAASADTATSATSATTATKLASAQNITLTGDVTGTASFDGSAAASIAATLKDSGVTAGTYTKVTVDAKGIVTAATNVSADDMPSNIPVSKITGLGTAATVNTGTAEGNVPVIGTGNTLDASVIPDIALSKVTGAGTAASKNTGTAEGEIPILGAEGKLDEAVLPALAITDTFTVENETAMLALDAQKGDVAVRSDISKSFILKQTPASTAANWVELRTPADAVLSVNGKTGAVTLTTDDIAEGSTKLYYTEARANANFATHASTELTDSDSLLRKTDTFIIDGGNASGAEA